MAVGMCWSALYIGLLLYTAPFVRRADDHLQLISQTEVRYPVLRLLFAC